MIVTVATLALAFPYAYLMVRTPSSALRKLLLIALFLPFFIGQVVRAYGWLIILGNQGLLNAGSSAWSASGRSGSSTTTRPCCSGWSSTCCPSPC